MPLQPGTWSHMWGEMWDCCTGPYMGQNLTPDMQQHMREEMYEHMGGTPYSGGPVMDERT